jgi:hypothetical protein
LSNYLVDGDDLTSIANAIRTKGGTSAQLAFPTGFVSAVQAIPTGAAPTGTKQININANGTTTEDVTNYASAQITVAVPQPSGSTEVGFDFRLNIISESGREVDADTEIQVEKGQTLFEISFTYSAGEILEISFDIYVEGDDYEITYWEGQVIAIKMESMMANDVWRIPADVTLVVE